MTTAIHYQSAVNWGSAVALKYRLASNPTAAPSVTYLKRDATNTEFFIGPFGADGIAGTGILSGDYFYTVSTVTGAGTVGDPWVAGSVVSAGVMRNTADSITIQLNDGASFALQEVIQAIVSSINASALGNIVASVVEHLVDGFPVVLYKKDARTDENGGAILVRIYAADDTEYTTPLFGVGTLLFVDAFEIWFGLTPRDVDTPEVEFLIEWIEEGTADGYFKIEFNETALDLATAFVAGSTTYHNWGIKVVWPTTPNPRTVATGRTKIVNRIVAAGEV